MADGWGVNDANALVLGLPSIGVLEKTGTIAKENGHNVDVHFVDQAGREVLLGDIRTAAQIDVFPPGSVFGLLQRRVNAFSDKVKSCSTLHFKRIAGVMRQHEDRHVKRRIVAPPTIPWIVSPWAIAAAKHVSAHNGRPDVLKIFRGDVVIGTSRAAFHSMAFTERSHRERPLMEFLATLAKWIRDALVRPGDVAVEQSRCVYWDGLASAYSSCQIHHSYGGVWG